MARERSFQRTSRCLKTMVCFFLSFSCGLGASGGPPPTALYAEPSRMKAWFLDIHPPSQKAPTGLGSILAPSQPLAPGCASNHQQGQEGAHPHMSVARSRCLINVSGKCEGAVLCPE